MGRKRKETMKSLTRKYIQVNKTLGMKMLLEISKKKKKKNSWLRALGGSIFFQKRKGMLHCDLLRQS